MLCGSFHGAISLAAATDTALGRHDFLALFLSLGVLLLLCRILGEAAKRFGQPTVLGELIAGLLLGPTILGRWQPQAFQFLFPATGSVAIVREGLATLAIVLFLFVAGMEVDLGRIWKQGRTAMSVSVFGTLLPFAVGFVAAWFLPGLLGGLSEGPASSRLIFALFFATAMSISALPVIAKTLMDLKLYRTDMGMVVLAAAVFNDLIGWLIFGLVLGLMRSSADQADTIPGAFHNTAILTLVYIGLMLTLGRWVMHRILPWLQAHLSWPGGVLGFSLTIALFGAAFTEWVGVHAIFGAFIFGVALGDSKNLRDQTRHTLNDFISYFFAPIFFGCIGLQADFVAEFDFWLVLTVFLIASVGKILPCFWAARWAGMPKREAWAVGFGMNARGAMEIILGLVALRAGLIDTRLFVALVIMAVVTSMLSGPVMKRMLPPSGQWRIAELLTGRGFVARLAGADRPSVIAELSRAAEAITNLPADHIESAVLERELMMATGVPGGVAVPHARLEGLAVPVVVAGISENGVHFDAVDQQPSHLIFLVLTPLEDQGAQLQLLADIGHRFQYGQSNRRVWQAKSFTQFVALVRSELPASRETEGVE